MSNVQLVIIEPTHKIPMFGCGTGRFMYLKSVRKEFVEAITTTDMGGVVPSFLIGVKGVLGDLTLQFDQEKGRFVVIYDSQEERRRRFGFH